MRKLIPFLVLGITFLVLLYYAAMFRPDVVNQILIKVDVFGITDVSKAEKTRLAYIDNLSITFEEKEVLKNKTVFMGASVDMARLALGEPKRAIQKDMENKGTAIYLVYYLPEDKRPTVLVFVENKLVQAYKASALDF